MTLHAVGRAALAGLLVAAACLVLGTSASPGRRAAAGVPSRFISRGGRRDFTEGSARFLWLGVGGLVWFALTAAHRLGVGRWAGLVPTGLAAAVAAVLVRRAVRQRRRTDADLMAAAAFEAVSVLAADLSVGRAPAQALADLVDDLGSAQDATRSRLSRVLRPVVEAEVLGGSVPAALRLAAGTDGCAELERLASAWQLAESLGAPVAQVLDGVGTSLRHHADHRRAVRAELAGPRASARLLATLPVLGILMGTGLGARPLQVLFGTAYGQAALVGGVALELAGLAWTDRLAVSAERT
jgi:tight adherence protein B